MGNEYVDSPHKKASDKYCPGNPEFVYRWKIPELHRNSRELMRNDRISGKFPDGKELRDPKFFLKLLFFFFLILYLHLNSNLIHGNRLDNLLDRREIR